MTEEEEKTHEAASLKKDQIIALMSVYLSEWEHRDELLWTQVFRYFYATLIVIILPNAATFIGIDLPQINIKLFPIIGMLMALIFLYVGLGYAIRLRASSRTYEKIMGLIGDKEYERISIKDKSKIKLGYLFATPMAMVLVLTMFAALEAVAILLLLI